MQPPAEQGLAHHAVLAKFDERAVFEGILFFGQSNAGAPIDPKTTLLEPRHPERLFCFGASHSYGDVKKPKGTYHDFRALRNPISSLLIQTAMAYALEGVSAVSPQPRFFHSVWWGSQPIASFLPGSVPYGNLVNVADDFYTVTQAYGRSARIEAVVWIQGENRSEDYAQDLALLLDSLKTDVQKTLQQESPPLCIVAQINAHSGVDKIYPIALDQLNVALNTPGVVLAGPMYNLPFVTPASIHPGECGRLIYGELLALVYRTIVIEKKPFEPLHPLSAEWTGAAIALRFHLPALPLAMDEAWVMPANNFGFVVVDEAGCVDISKVVITTADTVEITPARPVKAARVLYAMNQGETQPNGWSGARGQLISPTSQLSLFHQEGFDIPKFIMHYCARFVMDVS
jgi:hypothetical protein